MKKRRIRDIKTVDRSRRKSIQLVVNSIHVMPEGETQWSVLDPRGNKLAYADRSSALRKAMEIAKPQKGVMLHKRDGVIAQVLEHDKFVKLQRRPPKKSLITAPGPFAVLDYETLV